MDHADDNENKELVEQVLQEVQVRELRELYNFMSVWNTSSTINEVSRRTGISVESLYGISREYLHSHPIYLKALDNEDYPDDDWGELSEAEIKKMRDYAVSKLDEGDLYYWCEKALCMKRWTGALPAS